MTEKTYWNGNGKHQNLYEKLVSLIPQEGSIKGTKNKCLEKLRRAGNAYYQVFNNGNMVGFSKTWGFACTPYGYRKPVIGGTGRYARVYYTKVWDWDSLMVKMDPVLDQLILDAADEQGVE